MKLLNKIRCLLNPHLAAGYKAEQAFESSVTSMAMPGRKFPKTGTAFAVMRLSPTVPSEETI